MAHRTPSSLTPMPAMLRYGIAVLSAGIAIGLEFFLLRHFEAKLTPFLFAVAVTVWYAGTGPGVLAIVLSVLSLNYFFLRPGFSFSPLSYADLVYLTFCILCALAVGWVSAVRRRAEQELRQAREGLEAKVVERTANLQRSERYLAETQKLTQTGSWAWDARRQKVLYCSEEMFRIFGLDPHEHLPTRKNFRQRVHPEDRNRVDERFARAVNERVDSFDEYRVLLPDGTVRLINASGHPVLDEDGELIEFIGTAVDVTERKRAELERRRLALLVEQAADLMAISDLSGGTPIYLNKAGLKMVGFDSWEEARAWRGIHYMFPEDRRFVNEVLWPTVLEKGSWSGEMRFRHFKTGDPIPILYSAFRIDDPETGQPVNVGNVCTDITERKRAEAEARENDRRYREMQMELAHANRVATMGQLTASIAHEVNQPLTAVVANAEACLRWLDRGTPNLDAVRRSVKCVIDDANRASEVIRRVRALANKTEIEKVPLDVNDVVREIIALVQRELISHQVSLRTEFEPALPMILGDRVQLQQVIINLVMNGIEAMQSVTDRPRELVVRSAHGTQEVLVSVTDCGVGISAENADRLFTAFFTTKSGGMGMGLSICRSIMEAYGGRLWATANVSHGATFQFTLPVNADTAS
jgi:PAS domain S-box-containing protein